MLNIGDQIAYIPMHANGEIGHPDVEFGFITGFNRNGDPFCRYYRRGTTELRTVANSECTPKEMIVPFQSVPQSKIMRFLDEHYPDWKEYSR